MLYLHQLRHINVIYITITIKLAALITTLKYVKQIKFKNVFYTNYFTALVFINQIKMFIPHKLFNETLNTYKIK